MKMPTLVKELKDKFILLTDNGSPTTVAKTPFNTLKFGVFKGKPIHLISIDGCTVNEENGTLMITKNEISLPLLVGRHELAALLLQQKDVNVIWQRNHKVFLGALNISDYEKEV